MTATTVKAKVIDSMILSANAYREIQPETGETELTTIDDLRNGVRCFIRNRGDALIITFRGSDNANNWRSNLMFRKKIVPYNNTASKIRVHSGFINAYKSPDMRGKIHSFITGDIRRVRICGHSFGGAMAILCGVDLEYNFPDREYEVITYGAPRLGNDAFVKSYNRRVVNTLRVENGNDIVTKLPLAFWGFRHAGAKVHVGLPRVLGAFSFADHYPHAYLGNIVTGLLP